MIPLGNVADFEMGQAPPGIECNKDGEGTLFVKAGEFGDLYPIEREWTTRPLKHGKRGDVFICVVGATAGKLNLGTDCAIGRSVAAIRPRPTLETKYLYYQLQPWVLKLRAASAGSAQGVISKKQLAEVPVTVPAIEEQRSIVAEIEKQFSRLDEAVANLKRVKANLKRYKAAVLKAAVEGRLVPTEAELARREGRSYETGARLLQRILETRHSQWKGKGKYEEPAAPDATDLSEPPEGWAWGCCNQILTSIEAGASFKCVERPPEGDETGVLKVSAVSWGRFDESESKTCQDSERIEKDYLVQAGDFLFSRANTIDLVGACVVVGDVSKRLMLSDKTLRFRLAGPFPQPWLLICLRTRFGRQEIERLATGNQDSMRNIGQERIRQIRLPIPPLVEQHRIVAEVDRRLSLVREVEAEVDANLKRGEGLRQSVLQTSFAADALAAQ